MNPSSELKKLYHERQEKQLCLLHTLNNLFQRKEFQKVDLDEICINLDESRWFNAHRSMLGLGNYDVNILISALEMKDFCMTWFDNRLSARRINPDAVFGYIFNIPSTSFIPFLKNRHWFSVIRRGKNYYNLDSKLPEPIIIDDFIVFANKHLAAGNQLLLVSKKEDADRCVNKEEE
uniref:ubiquitinyl hydrolase 1 n=1 Tax=Acrobeloides nanus TaxID=290746 RepID=A0A914EMN9_9BILA